MSDRTHRPGQVPDRPQSQDEAVQSGQPAGPLDDRMKNVRRGREEASAQIARTLRVWRKVSEAQGEKPEAEPDEGKAGEDDGGGTSEKQAEAGEGAEEKPAQGGENAEEKEADARPDDAKEGDKEEAPKIAAKLQDGMAPKIFRSPDPGGGGGDDQWRREPRDMAEQMVLREAQSGQGRMIIASLNDARFKGMQKWHHSKAVAGGRTVVVHYVVDPKTGEKKDFKFKD